MTFMSVPVKSLLNMSVYPLISAHSLLITKLSENVDDGVEILSYTEDPPPIRQSCCTLMTVLLPDS